MDVATPDFREKNRERCVNYFTVARKARERDRREKHRAPCRDTERARSERLVANYLPWLTAGMLRPTPRKRRMVSMNLGTEIGLDR